MLYGPFDRTRGYGGDFELDGRGSLLPLVAPNFN